MTTFFIEDEFSFRRIDEYELFRLCARYIQRPFHQGLILSAISLLLNSAHGNQKSKLLLYARGICWRRFPEGTVSVSDRKIDHPEWHELPEDILSVLKSAEQAQ